MVGHLVQRVRKRLDSRPINCRTPFSELFLTRNTVKLVKPVEYLQNFIDTLIDCNQNVS